MTKRHLSKFQCWILFSFSVGLNVICPSTITSLSSFSGCLLTLSSIYSSWTYSQVHILSLMLWGIWIPSVSVTLTREFTMGMSILGISGMIIPGIGCLTTSGDSDVDKCMPDGIAVSDCTTSTASRGFSLFSSWWVALFLPVLLGLALAYVEEVFLFDLLNFCSGIKTTIDENGL